MSRMGSPVVKTRRFCHRGHVQAKECQGAQGRSGEELTHSGPVMEDELWGSTCKFMNSIRVVLSASRSASAGMFLIHTRLAFHEFASAWREREKEKERERERGGGGERKAHAA
jgi:hypothetical protein